MKTILSIAAAGLFALSTLATAYACSGHPSGHTAEISKPVTTAGTPIMTPRPTSGG